MSLQLNPIEETKEDAFDSQPRRMHRSNSIPLLNLNDWESKPETKRNLEYGAMDEHEDEHEDEQLLLDLTEYNNYCTTDEVANFLDNFAPNLSLSEGIIIFIINPISLFINISFIIYNFIQILKSEYNVPRLRFAKKFISCVEFGGLILLLSISIISYLCRFVPMSVDALKLCKSWSTMKLFYDFRPLTLLEYYNTTYGHHQLRLKETQTKSVNKWLETSKRLKNELKRSDKNIDPMNYNTMSVTLDKLQKVIDKWSWTCNQCHAVNQKYRNEKTAECKDCGRKIQYNSNDVIKDEEEILRFKGLFAFTAEAQRRISLFSLVLISIFLLFVGFMSLTLKLAAFSFISNVDVLSWSLSEWILFVGFTNQIWNICDQDTIKMNTIYHSLYMNSTAKFTRFVSCKSSILDGTIKKKFIQTLGFKIGYIMALGLNATILHRIVCKDKINDISMQQLLQKKPYQHEIDCNRKLSEKSSSNYTTEENIKAYWIGVNSTKKSILKKILNGLTHNVITKRFRSIKQTICLDSYQLQVPDHPLFIAQKYIIKDQQKEFVLSTNLDWNIFRDLALLSEKFGIVIGYLLQILNIMSICIILVSTLAFIIIGILIIHLESESGKQLKCHALSYYQMSWIVVSCFVICLISSFCVVCNALKLRKQTKCSTVFGVTFCCVFVGNIIAVVVIQIISAACFFNEPESKYGTHITQWSNCSVIMICCYGITISTIIMGYPIQFILGFSWFLLFISLIIVCISLVIQFPTTLIVEMIGLVMIMHDEKYQECTSYEILLIFGVALCIIISIGLLGIPLILSYIGKYYTPTPYYKTTHQKGQDMAFIFVVLMKTLISWINGAYAMVVYFIVVDDCSDLIGNAWPFTATLTVTAAEFFSWWSITLFMVIAIILKAIIEAISKYLKITLY